MHSCLSPYKDRTDPARVGPLAPMPVLSFSPYHTALPFTYLSSIVLRCNTGDKDDSASRMTFNITELPTLAVLISCCLFLWRCWTRKRSTVAGPPSSSWLQGNFPQLFNPKAWSFHKYLCDTYGGVVKIHMPFNQEALYVTDPLALHYIIEKEQHIYEETENFLVSSSLVFGDSLLSTLGSRHKRQRKMLNPLFSTANLREILPSMRPVAHELESNFTAQVEDGPQIIDVMRWISRAALENIGRGVLGHSFGPLDEEKSTVYSGAIRNLGVLLFRTMRARMFLPYVIKFGTPQFRRQALDMSPFQTMKDLAKVVDEMYHGAIEVVQEKREAIERGDEATEQLVSNGKDIISILLRANKQADKEDRLPDSEVLGQVNTFIFGGTDTTSNGLCRVIDQLARNPDAQRRLREEVIEFRRERGGADFDFDTLMALPYLDVICRETLRLYPPITTVMRTARDDTVMPLEWPVFAGDGKTMLKGIPVKKGQRILVSIFGANRHKGVWGEDAEEWKPERWLKSDHPSISQLRFPGVYASMMTFFGGGRACVGFKLAEMEMKFTVASLVEKFIFEPGPEVFWEMTSISRPTVPESGSPQSQLPLRFSLYKP